MPTSAGEKKLEVYINHLVNAQLLLQKLPNRYYRSAEANSLIYEQMKTLKGLQVDFEKLIKELEIKQTPQK